MTAVVADSPDLRADLRRAEKLGISLRRFHGWEPATYTANGRTFTEPEYDAWERALWRALDDWEATRCPGCGNDISESLWDPKRPAHERPGWHASYRQCRACEVLLIAQNVQSKRDEERAKALPKGTAPPPTQHRHWSVIRDDEKGRK